MTTTQTKAIAKADRMLSQPMRPESRARYAEALWDLAEMGTPTSLTQELEGLAAAHWEAAAR